MWYQDKEIDKTPVISSRIRLARNILGYPFFTLLKANDAKKMIDQVIESLATMNLNFTDIKNINNIEKLAMLERHKISLELLRSSSLGGVLSSKDEAINIMLNEEDHIRIQSILPGKNIQQAYVIANDLDNIIEDKLEYYFDERLGYLSSCPSNVGTGLRASVMIHLPMLEHIGKLSRVVSSLRSYGMTIRGIYGESSESLGSIYQVSNQITLGRSEEEILYAIENVVDQIVTLEMQALTDYILKKPIGFEDMMYRAYGILSNCRKIDIKEARNLLSTLRIGIVSGLLKDLTINEPIYKILMMIEYGNLQLNSKKILADTEIDIARADYIRNALT